MRKFKVYGLGSLIDGCIECSEAVVVYDVGVRISPPYTNLLLYYFCPSCNHRDEESVVLIRGNDIRGLSS